MSNILKLDASARTEGSVSRELADALAVQLAAGGAITRRDLSETPVPQIDGAWVKANFTPAEKRDDADRVALGLSDSLVSEVEAADQIVIGVPIYNFSVPAALKAWIDQVARAGRTFRYTENGPVGLLEGKTVWLVVASGGTALDSEIDFATPYLRHVLGFLGLHDVRVIDASRWGFRSEDDKQAVLDEVSAVKAAA